MRYRLVFGTILAVAACCRPILADEPPAGEAAWKLPSLPPAKLPSSEDWYGPANKRQGLEGRVLAAFDITTKGAVQNIKVVWAENDLLGAQTAHLLSGAHFEVPKDWATSGALIRWRIGFVYCLVPSGQSEEFAIPVNKVYVSGARLPGAPVRTKPAPGSTDTCGKPHH